MIQGLAGLRPQISILDLLRQRRDGVRLSGIDEPQA